jgi:hypothetical protein
MCIKNGDFGAGVLNTFVRRQSPDQVDRRSGTARVRELGPEYRVRD